MIFYIQPSPKESTPLTTNSGKNNNVHENAHVEGEERVGRGVVGGERERGRERGAQRLEELSQHGQARASQH